MPQTQRQTSQKLDVQVFGNSTAAYKPGQTIQGNVIRTAHLVATDARITVSLIGRAKTKTTIVRREQGRAAGNGRPAQAARRSVTVYRGRWPLCSIGTIAHSGPIHIPPAGGSATWPFAITIPFTPDPRVFVGGHDQAASLLPLAHADIERTPLPGTFQFSHSGRGGDLRCEGFVEYFLRIELVAQGNIGGGTTIALAPLLLRGLTTPQPITDYNYAAKTENVVVRTLRLIPGNEDMELTFGQKAAKFFGSSSVPRFKFAFDCLVPTKLQFAHPTSIAILLRIRPDLEATTELIRETPSPVTLESFSFSISTLTDIVCEAPGLFSPGVHSDTIKDKDRVDLTPVLNALRAAHGNAPIAIPIGQDPAYLNIGEHLSLSLTSTGFTALGREVARLELTPGFTTYNIRRYHEMKWKARISCRGEKETVEGWTAVHVVGHSEAQMDASDAARNGILLSQQQPPQPFQTSEMVPDRTADEFEGLPAYEPSYEPRFVDIP
ncbi:hypothetical protein HKX48_005376 [Thoreauomyces humboldtii]|nr:hypothetical protein HKX48_005376 [Thoreauomyces humboldtii]